MRDLGSIPSVWLVWAIIVVAAWSFGGPGWVLLLGIIGGLGGLAMTLHALFFLSPERNLAVEAMERYARGEIDQEQLESTLRDLEKT